MAEPVHFDVVIVGGGPAGLSAAIYTAREGMATLLLEKSIYGGMAAITEIIENYPGFSQGIGGQQLVQEMQTQAERFGAQLKQFEEVTGLTRRDDHIEVTTSNASINARTVLIATGSSYRKLDVPGEAELIGRGIHFCATCDAPLYKGKSVVVVGGGNSALQESLFIARFADQVTILVRGDSFSGTHSIIEQVEAEPKIQVIFNAKITSFAPRELRSPISLTRDISGEESTVTADGVFVFVGLIPCNHGFDNIDQDERGFMRTDAHYATQIPGVFVAGDIRSGSTWQIASSVGEAVSAALEMRTYLDKTYPDWHK